MDLWIWTLPDMHSVCFQKVFLLLGKCQIYKSLGMVSVDKAHIIQTAVNCDCHIYMALKGMFNKNY